MIVDVYEEVGEEDDDDNEGGNLLSALILLLAICKNIIYITTSVPILCILFPNLLSSHF